MYTVTEYLFCIALVLLLGAVLLVAAIALTLTQEGAKALAETSRKAAERLAESVSHAGTPIAGSPAALEPSDEDDSHRLISPAS